jgi:hypothetical protein
MPHGTHPLTVAGPRSLECGKLCYQSSIQGCLNQHLFPPPANEIAGLVEGDRSLKLSTPTEYGVLPSHSCSLPAACQPASLLGRLVPSGKRPSDWSSLVGGRWPMVRGHCKPAHWQFIMVAGQQRCKVPSNPICCSCCSCCYAATASRVPTRPKDRSKDDCHLDSCGRYTAHAELTPLLSPASYMESTLHPSRPQGPNSLLKQKPPTPYSVLDEAKGRNQRRS